MSASIVASILFLSTFSTFFCTARFSAPAISAGRTRVNLSQEHATRVLCSDLGTIQTFNVHCTMVQATVQRTRIRKRRRVSRLNFGAPSKGNPVAVLLNSAL